MSRPQASTHHRFHSHPALPPHPLLKLHRPVSHSPTQQGSSPAPAADSPPQQNTADDSRNLKDRHKCLGGSANKGTSSGGPKSSSPSGTAQHCLAGCQANVAEAGSNDPIMSQPASFQRGVKQCTEDCHVEHSEVQQQPQQHWLQWHDMSAASDDIEQCTRHVVSSHGALQDSAGAEQQDQSDTGSEQSESSEHASARAVGDDELLDYEPDLAMEAHAAQAANLAPSWHHTGHSSVPFGMHSADKPSVSSNAEADIPSDQLTQADGQSPRGVPSDQEGMSEAMPWYTVKQGVSQNEGAVRHAEQWCQQASMPAGANPCRPQQLHRERQEHVSWEPSKLRAAYRSHYHPVAQQDQHEELEQQRELPCAQQRHPGAAVIKYSQVACQSLTLLLHKH